jgi:hypothetical protein
MDKVIAAAVRSGFTVRQTTTGAWHFRTGITTMIFYRTPISSTEWVTMIKTLQGAGLVFPLIDEESMDLDEE